MICCVLFRSVALSLENTFYRSKQIQLEFICQLNVSIVDFSITIKMKIEDVRKSIREYKIVSGTIRIINYE